MSEIQPEPAAAAEPPRVKFGARDDDSMPASWAERGLTWLHDTKPAVFAEMMLAIVGVQKGRRS